MGAFAERGLLECAVPQHIPWVAFCCRPGPAAALAWARWLVAHTKNLTFLEPPTAGQNLSLCAAQSELGERQCNLGLNMSQSDKSEIVGKENMLIK